MSGEGSSSDGDGLSWEREDTHWPDRLSRWGVELFMTRQSRGIGEICEDSGFLFETVRTREIDGWAYMAVVPLGGKARKPPPNWLVPLLIRVVPDLRRRVATLRRIEAEGYWQDVIDRWLDGEEEELLAEGNSYLDRDLSELDDTELADLLAEAWEYADRAVKKHFHLHGGGINEIMRMAMELNREHGFTTADVSGLLTGLSHTTTGPGAAQAEIVELIERHGGTDTLMAATSLDEVHGIDPEVAAALDTYAKGWGRRALRYEIAYPTVGESPERLLDMLKAQAARPAAADLEAEHAATRADVERRVLDALGDTAETRERIDRARRAFPIREGNETATIAIPAAVMRRLGQEAGRRLAGSGALSDAEHVFDALPSEVDAALRGHAAGDLADTAAGRHAARLAPVDDAPPATIGPEMVPPDLSGFPDDVREPVEAVLWFASKASAVRTGIADADDGQHAAATDRVLAAGLGVAAGVYEGTARVVLDETGFHNIEPGDVLVCPITSPIWSMVFPSIGALVCDAGGPLSHPAIIAREFGIPAVVDTGDATGTLRDGQLVRVDGGAGTVVAVDA